MKEDTLYRWRGWLLGAALLLIVVVLMISGVLTTEQAKEWLDSLLAFVKERG